MNPLAGGIIAKNQDFFEYAKFDSDKTVISAALCFIKAHPAVNLILSGAGSEEEITANVETFRIKSDVPDKERLCTVLSGRADIENYCSGCNYCDGCPVKIPVREIMQRRNRLLFKPEQTYNRTDTQLVQNINIFYYSDWKPETADNPCIHCGKCEKKCTMHLNIQDAIDDTYKRAKSCGYSHTAEQNRLKEILSSREYNKIGLYPSGGFANKIIDIYTEVYPDKKPEWVQFNSNKAICDNPSGGRPVCHSSEILNQKPDIIIVCSYKYQDEIYGDLIKYENDGIEIVKLHRENDVPWVW
jgi:ferredoxin